MLCDTNLSLALKSEAGEYRIFNFSIFQIKNGGEQFENCKINLTRHAEINIKMKCPICGKNHCYKFKINDFRNTKMFTSGCENSGLTVFFIGEFEMISDTINKQIYINSMIYAMI